MTSRLNYFTLSHTLKCLGILLVCFAPAAAHGKDINLTAGLGVEFATGKYGTDTTTDSVALPLTIRYYPIERLGFELIVPYLYQSNGTTTTVGMFRFRRGGTGQTQGGGNSGGQGSNGQGPGGSGQPQGTPAFDTGRSQSGIGNVTLKTGYVVWQEGELNPQVKPLLYVQFPTADKDKGLGTGEFTTGIGMELSKWLSDWYIYGEGIYNFPGSSDEFALKNFFSYEAGIGYQLTDRIRPTLLALGATAPSDDSSDIAEARFKINYRLTGRASAEGYLAAGLTNGSSDFGTGLSVFYDF
jgi:hypothetical protein